MENKTVQKIIDYMKLTGLNQKQISSLLDVNPWTLSRWLKGKTDPLKAHKDKINRVIK